MILGLCGSGTLGLRAYGNLGYELWDGGTLDGGTLGLRDSGTLESQSPRAPSSRCAVMPRPVMPTGLPVDTGSVNWALLESRCTVTHAQHVQSPMHIMLSKNVNEPAQGHIWYDLYPNSFNQVK